MPTFFDPTQSMNAFASGAQMGGAIRNKQTANTLAPMVARGDLKGAMDYAGSRGDLAMMDYVRPQAEAAQAKALKQGIGNALASGDTKGAMAQAYGAGEIETGMALYGHNRAMRADEITDQKSGIDYLVSNVDKLMAIDENDPRRADEAMRIIMDSVYGQDPNVVSAVQAAIADNKLSDAELKQFQQELLTPAQRVEGQRYDAEQEYTRGRDKIVDDQWKMEHDRKLAADRASASAASAKAEAGARFGVTPVYGRDASGNRVLIQTSDRGEINQAELPEGVTLEDDRYKSSQRALGTAEGKKAAYQTEAGQAVIAAQDKADQIIANIDQAIEQSDFWNTGVTGKAVWSSDFNATLDSIGANAMLSELLNLKRQGGTLGALSEGEGKALRAAAVNITRSQSEDQLDDNLRAYKLQVQRTVDLLKQAYEADYESGMYGQAQPSQGGAAPQSPQYEQTATNSQTGQKIGFRNGQWEPIQ